MYPLFEEDITKFFDDNNYVYHIRVFDTNNTDQSIEYEEELDNMITKYCKNIDLMEEASDRKYEINKKISNSDQIISECKIDDYTLYYIQNKHLPDKWLIYQNNELVCLKTVVDVFSHNIQQIQVFLKYSS